MTLEMRGKCERCGIDLATDAAAWIRVYECTFCTDCAEMPRHVCPDCGEEMVRRPRSPAIGA